MRPYLLIKVACISIWIQDTSFSGKDKCYQVTLMNKNLSAVLLKFSLCLDVEETNQLFWLV